MFENETLALLALIALSFYIPISRGRPKYLCGMQVDKRVPFLPIFVVPYLAFFPFVFGAMLALYGTDFSAPFFLSLTIVGILYAVLAPFIGCGAQRADAHGKGILRGLVRVVYWFDGPYNNAVFPSTHVYLSVICGYFLAVAFPEYAVLSWVSALLIAVSTVFIKQHNVMDIGGGVVWAATAIYLSSLIIGFFS